MVDADVIVHTPGQVAMTTSMVDPRTDVEINFQGTFNLLEAARKAGSDPEFASCSMNKVYGGNVNAIPVKEDRTRCVYAGWIMPPTLSFSKLTTRTRTSK